MIVFDENKAWELLATLASRGKRPPGTVEHQESIQYLLTLMQDVCSRAWLQPFSLQLKGKNIDCANICGFLEGRDTSSTVLVGSHFDTRWIADNEKDVIMQDLPIPGVNDGTSGVVIILELARILKQMKPEKNILFILFDAEDIGIIDGYEFGFGAGYYAKHGDIRPDLVIVLDMVGGENMHLTVDLHSFTHLKSRKVFGRLFAIGRDFGYPCFFNNRTSLIISDHYPFLKRKIPALVLIDIDYPQWHTHSDTIDHCSRNSLKYIGDVLFHFLTHPLNGII
ncbi:MAG: M28 family peptidase [Spirochaetales bacterium]|nr:M28 family peptidase [Spirochaetales bacterium]